MANPQEQAQSQPAPPEGQEPGRREQEQPAEGALLETLRRERADFLNYKRRTEQERARDRQDAESQIIERILPVIDELERALSQVPDELREHPWVQSLALNHHKLIQTLSDLGIERIGAKGEAFNPQQHEALFYDIEPGSSARQRGLPARLPDAWRARATGAGQRGRPADRQPAGRLQPFGRSCPIRAGFGH